MGGNKAEGEKNLNTELPRTISLSVKSTFSLNKRGFI